MISLENNKMKKEEFTKEVAALIEAKIKEWDVDGRSQDLPEALFDDGLEALKREITVHTVYRAEKRLRRQRDEAFDQKYKQLRSEKKDEHGNA
jgi:hypothetical protein